MPTKAKEAQFFVIPSPVRASAQVPLGNPEDRIRFRHSGYVEKVRRTSTDADRWRFSIMKHLTGLHIGQNIETEVDDNSPHVLRALPPTILVVCETQVKALIAFFNYHRVPFIHVKDSSATCARRYTRWH